MEELSWNDTWCNEKSIDLSGRNTDWVQFSFLPLAGCCSCRLIFWTLWASSSHVGLKRTYGDRNWGPSSFKNPMGGKNGSVWICFLGEEGLKNKERARMMLGFWQLSNLIIFLYIILIMLYFYIENCGIHNCTYSTNL